jgi:outer membrane receptor protein involved in Fe transport
VLRTAGFIQYMDRTIGAPFGSGATFLPTGQVLLAARNLGGSREAGGELVVKGQDPCGLRWNVGYALALVHDETGGDILSTSSSVGYENQTPTHSVTLGLGYTVGRFDFDMQSRWQSRFFDYELAANQVAPHLNQVPDYLTVHARIGYRLTRNLTLALVADQLNSSSLTESAGVPVERRGFATASFRF